MYLKIYNNKDFKLLISTYRYLFTRVNATYEVTVARIYGGDFSLGYCPEEHSKCAVDGSRVT